MRLRMFSRSTPLWLDIDLSLQLAENKVQALKAPYSYFLLLARSLDPHLRVFIFILGKLHFCLVGLHNSTLK